MNIGVACTAPSINKTLRAEICVSARIAMKMTLDAVGIQIVPLVPNAELPRPASARTREHVPSGYGVQEQCLPFTAGSALGFLIPSPIRFGHCPPQEVPEGCRAFRSPITQSAGESDWVFYVADNPACRFAGNAYSLTDIPRQGTVLEPGISFFDREDQQDLFKLHLPYIWRTPQNIDTLFLPLLNRTGRGLQVQSGLVETAWYANPVNLILRKATVPVHYRQGEEVAHAVLIPRDLRAPSMEVAASHARLTRDTREALAVWYEQHAQDRSAYKVLARSRHGRVDS